MIILFYSYVHIEDPELLATQQRELCEKLGLRGRIILSKEGINATLEGADESMDIYCSQLLADPRFADVQIKKSQGSGRDFPKLSIKVRKEIVSLHLPDETDVNPRTQGGTYLTPEQLHEMLEEAERTGVRDFEIVDMRNEYEHKSGHFKGSILPPLRNFRDLPKVLPTLASFKKKKVIGVCTGGVRCEKATAYLKQQGFENVYQLHGGIVTYMEKYQNPAAKTPLANHFQGALYVFDDRVTMAFAPKEMREVIGICELCGASSELYVNCANSICHKHFIACEKCQEIKPVYCNAQCREKCQELAIQHSSTNQSPVHA